MATNNQITANRRNARKSTGPRKTAGKARSGGNALKHGLTATQVVLFDEDPAALPSVTGMQAGRKKGGCSGR